MPFVEIFLPTGHREKLEINANTTLMTVLEDVCIKRGLRAENCYLSYNKAKIDLSLKFGMSRLLNNVKLDLIESPVSLIENVSIDVVLQLPDSSRVNNSFCPKESLFSIMESFAKLRTELKSIIFPDDNELTPVIYHLHDQIVGEYCLKHTTLSSLGLRIGRILFRLEYKRISDEDKLMFDEMTRLRVEKCLTAEKCRQKQEIKLSTEASVTAVPTGIHVPDSNTIHSSIDRLPTSDFTPFSPFSNTNVSIFDNDNTAQKEVPPAKKEPKTLGELLGINLEHESWQSNEDILNTQSFLDFKFPDISMDYENAAEENKDDSDAFVRMEERESVLYQYKPADYIPNNGEEFPETFFELTEHDLRSIIQSYRNIAESDNPLMTNALREQMREKRFSKYQRCIIQFHFKDAYILQSVFKPHETVEDMYRYIKQFFRNNSSNFHLFTSPPKDILKNKEKNLIQSDLVPMCKVYVSVSAKELFNNVDQLLAGDEETARQIIQKWMKSESNDGASGSGTSARETADKSNSGNAHKTPKWFKSGK